MSGPDRPGLGIALTLLAVLLFTLLDATAKDLAGTVDTAMLVWVRYAFGLGWLLLVLTVRRQSIGTLGTARPWMHTARGLLLVGSTAFMFASVRFLPLATIYAVAFVAPLLVAAMAPLLGERVRPAQWAAILFGFAGVLVAVRPSASGMDGTILLPFGMAACYAVYQVLTRITGQTDPALHALLYVTAVGFLTACLAVPFGWGVPDPRLWAGFAVMGALGTAGHLCLIRALSVAPASTVSPFTYTQIVWAALFGTVWFGEPPDLPTIVGSALVIAGGLWLMRMR